MVSSSAIISIETSIYKTIGKPVTLLPLTKEQDKSPMLLKR
jgi:hypothetical protein